MVPQFPKTAWQELGQRRHEKTGISPAAEVGRGHRWCHWNCHEKAHPRSTYIRRVQSCVWRLPKYWPPPSPPSECVPLAPKAGGTHSPGGEGGEVSKFWKTPAIGLASYTNLSTAASIDTSHTLIRGPETAKTSSNLICDISGRRSRTRPPIVSLEPP